MSFTAKVSSATDRNRTGVVGSIASCSPTWIAERGLQVGVTTVLQVAFPVLPSSVGLVDVDITTVPVFTSVPVTPIGRAPLADAVATLDASGQHDRADDLDQTLRLSGAARSEAADRDRPGAGRLGGDLDPKTHEDPHRRGRRSTASSSRHSWPPQRPRPTTSPTGTPADHASSPSTEDGGRP